MTFRQAHMLAAVVALSIHNLLYVDVREYGGRWTIVYRCTDSRALIHLRDSHEVSLATGLRP